MLVTTGLLVYWSGTQGLSYHFYADDTQLSIYLLKRHRPRICQHVHLLLKIVLKILTFGC